MGSVSIPAAIAIGAGSLGSSLIGASAAESAASTEAGANQAAINAELAMFNQAQTTEAPFVSTGTNALGSLMSLLGLGGATSATSPVLAALGVTPSAGGGVTSATAPGGLTPATLGQNISPSSATISAFQSSPAYNFQLQQGLNAITNSAAANGGLGGNALQALTSYGTGLANQDYYNYINTTNQAVNSNYTNYLNYLNTLGGAWNSLTGTLTGVGQLGQNAAGNNASNSVTTGGQIANLLSSTGASQAAGTVGAANAISGGINNLTSNYLLASLLGNGGGGYVAGGTF